MSDFLQKTTPDGMIEQIEAWYQQLEIPFQFHESQNTSLRNLVDGTSNRNLPIHWWFNLKEAYSAELPRWVITRADQKYGVSIRNVFDPFIGSGTTGVSLAQIGIDVLGLEYNPFIQLVARTKSHYPKLVRREIQEVIEGLHLGVPTVPVPIPNLSTFSNQKYFRLDDVETLASAVQQIKGLDCNPIIKDFLLLGVAATIDDVANLRKDGRALRYVEKPQRPPAKNAIISHWEAMLSDFGAVTFTGDFQVFEGTAIQLPSLETSSKVDMVLYSPPYLNNFDYSEIYKLELWLLESVSSVSEWRDLRRATIRSHPSVKFPESNHLETDSRMSEIALGIARLCDVVSLPDLRTRREMPSVISGYFDDMYLALKQQWELLRPGGLLVYVVANSRHKQLPIATDIILAAIAQQIGFEPLEISVLRKRNGRTRQKTYLRESAVFMRKP